jgi:hypothetical protein
MLDLLCGFMQIMSCKISAIAIFIANQRGKNSVSIVERLPLWVQGPWGGDRGGKIAIQSFQPFSNFSNLNLTFFSFQSPLRLLPYRIVFLKYAIVN